MGQRDWASLGLVVLLGCGTGCDTIEGSGRAAEERRELAAFDAVEVEAGLEADITPGAQEVIVQGDDNIVPYVRTTVEGAVLHVVPEHDFDPVVPLRITVSVPDLRRASLRAGGRVTLSDIEAAELELSVEAGGDLRAGGRVERLRADLSAGGTLDAAGLPADRVTIHGDAGGLLIVHAREEVTGSVVSGAEARVLGAPPVRDVRTDSGGEVHYE
jgi:hypothetical protein